MLKLAATLALAGLLLITSCTQPVRASVGKSAPDFRLESVTGQSVALRDFKGKPVLLNFWATWCPPCKEEMPYLQQIYEGWSAKGLVVLTVEIGESREEVETFLKENRLKLPVLLDLKKDAVKKYGITGIPTTFFIDPEGTIRQKIIGGFPNRAAIESQLVSIMP